MAPPQRVVPVGTKIGTLTVIGPAFRGLHSPSRPTGRFILPLKCDCGKELNLPANDYLKGVRGGHICPDRQHKDRPDYTGRRFGTVICTGPHVWSSEHGKFLIPLKCVCGTTWTAPPEDFFAGKISKCKSCRTYLTAEPGPVPNSILTILHATTIVSGDGKVRRAAWCQCRCGKELAVQLTHLSRNYSCGCVGNRAYDVDFEDIDMFYIDPDDVIM